MASPLIAILDHFLGRSTIQRMNLMKLQSTLDEFFTGIGDDKPASARAVDFEGPIRSRYGQEARCSVMRDDEL